MPRGKRPRSDRISLSEAGAVGLGTRGEMDSRCFGYRKYGLYVFTSDSEHVQGGPLGLVLKPPYEYHESVFSGPSSSRLYIFKPFALTLPPQSIPSVLNGSFGSSTVLLSLWLHTTGLAGCIKSRHNDLMVPPAMISPTDPFTTYIERLKYRKPGTPVRDPS